MLRQLLCDKRQRRAFLRGSRVNVTMPCAGPVAVMDSRIDDTHQPVHAKHLGAVILDQKLHKHNPCRGFTDPGIYTEAILRQLQLQEPTISATGES